MPEALLKRLESVHTVAHPQPFMELVDGRNAEVCGAFGDARSAKARGLNAYKNRSDVPAPNAYVPITWFDLKNLPGSRVEELQGAPVSVIGYLSHQIKVETAPPGESTNCHLHRPDEVDWHIYLTAEPNQPIADAIIVEATPRTRHHHSWTTAKLRQYLNSYTQVRISGWLLYDWEHLDVVGKQRATVWEVHPITRIEVQNGQGTWNDLDQR